MAEKSHRNADLSRCSTDFRSLTGIGRTFREKGKIPSPEAAALNDEPAPYAKPE